MIDEGTYKAKIVDWGIATTPNDKWKVVITFETVDKRISWNGWLTTDASKEVVMENLARCGWTGTGLEQLHQIAEGIPGGALDTEKELQIVVEHEWNETNQKTYANVKYINESGVQNKVLPDEVAKKFGGTAKAASDVKPSSTDELPF